MTTIKKPMSRLELIALSAMMFATVAFSIDAMLPALPEIGAQLSPDNLNRAQLILTSFVLGMGIGTLFAGPLSDRFGRKPVLISGALLYSICAFVAWRSQTLEVVLLARVFQGIGASGPRIVTMAIIRDMFSGREMARIVSFIMMVFTLVPAIAPAVGAVIIDFSGWRSIFIAFMVFSLITILWVGLRLPEPLAKENRRTFSLTRLYQDARKMWSLPVVRSSMLVQTLVFAALFGLISSVQPIYDVTYGHGEDFHLWFAGVALISGTASLLNASLVMRLGMRFLITVTVGVQILLAGVMIAALIALPVGSAQFYFFVAWQTSVFFGIGMTLGNLNAMAMEPLGHMAGTAASVMGAFSTICGAALAVPIGLAFNGTAMPLAVALCLTSSCSFLLMLRMKYLEGRG